MRKSEMKRDISILLIGLLLVSPGLCLGDSDRAHLDSIAKRDRVNEAVDKGLAYLVSQQDVVAGTFEGDKPNTYTALACMALMAAGHLPGRSHYGDNLRRGIMHLVRATKSHDGYLGQEANARMYGHGICTLALCEAYGMMEEERDNALIKEALERAIGVIINAQAKNGGHAGGWHYDPKPAAADLSVAAWQILALRAAQNCQIEIPEKTITDAAAYVRRCYAPGHKGFAYQAGSGPSPAMRSAGAVCMSALGLTETAKDREMIANSVAPLLTYDVKSGGNYYYQSYYIATAANMVGDEYRDELLPKVESALLDLQLPTGEFRKHSGHAAGVYSTAFSVISLCVRYQFLPIYQE
jgi:prenyltransferase beta subunit